MRSSVRICLPVIKHDLLQTFEHFLLLLCMKKYLQLILEFPLCCIVTWVFVPSNPLNCSFTAAENSYK